MKSKYRTCKLCLKTFPRTSQFWKSTRSFFCIVCKRIAIQRFNDLHRDKRNAKTKGWRIKNKERVVEYKRKYKKLYPERISSYRIRHYSKQENVEKKRLQDQNYRENNSKKIRARQYKWIMKNPHQKLRVMVSHSIRIALYKAGSSKKKCKTFDYLDYSPKELKAYLESKFEPWMNWNNWGLYIVETWDDNNQSTWTWQIDHIIPQSKLPYSSMEDENFKKCWSLENLRPLSAKENILRGNKEIVKESKDSNNSGVS